MYALLWSFAGDAKLKVRSDLGDFLRSITTIPLPPHMPNVPIIDYEVSICLFPAFSICLFFLLPISSSILFDNIFNSTGQYYW